MLILGFVTLVSSASATGSQGTATFEKAFIIQLSPSSGQSASVQTAKDHVAAFHERAASLDYSIRHEFHNSDVFLGLSIQINGNRTDEDVLQEIRAIEGVVAVSNVLPVPIPGQHGSAKIEPFLAYPDPPPLRSVTGSTTANLGSALEMGGIDKLHQLGIKGNGIKIGIVDTGIDYRHPALGAGFGPGQKIAGGYSFVYDNDTLGESPDPFISCYGGSHGTGVAGSWPALPKGSWLIS
jgi:subtilisin family serine protease